MGGLKGAGKERGSGRYVNEHSNPAEQCVRLTLTM